MSDTGGCVVEIEDEDACIVCDKLTKRKCALCNDVMICSIDCQQIAVIDDVDSEHFAECALDTTSGTLYKDILSNRIPKDAQTAYDFHFDVLPYLTDQRKLLKIYKIIIRKMDITPREMEIWAEEYCLFSRIAVLYLAYPKLISLDDLEWLKTTDLWTQSFGTTTRGIFEDVIARKQGKLQ